MLLMFLFAIINSSDCARILGIFPTPSISHQIVFRAITRDLAERGHHLVVLTTDPVKSNELVYKNVTEVDVHDVSYGIFNNINWAEKGIASTSRFVYLPLFFNALHDTFDAQMEHPVMKKIMGDKTETFDLLLIEHFTLSSYGFSHRFKAPTITVGSMPGIISTWEAAGNPTHPIVYPDVLSTHVGKKNFFQRLETFYEDLRSRVSDSGMTEKFDRQSKKLFGKDTPHVTELERNVDLVILNAFPVLSGIRPLTPTTIMTGGMHLKSKKPIPKSLQDYLDKSQNGVIYFSLGSNYKSSHLTPEIRQVIMDAFGELPYDVIWKYEKDILPGKPKNIMTSKWIPQWDMLGHPNIKVFIFQGGQQSMEESIMSGVPVVIMPFLGDQIKHAKILSDNNIGVQYDIKNITKESFKAAIIEVIQNKQYKENAVKFSNIITDDYQTPREKAIWWIEYVLRHKGAKHLRSPIMELPLYQYFMIDIFSFIIAILLVVLYITLRIYTIIISNRFFCKIKKE